MPWESCPRVPEWSDAIGIGQGEEVRTCRPQRMRSSQVTGEGCISSLLSHRMKTAHTAGRGLPRAWATGSCRHLISSSLVKTNLSAKPISCADAKTFIHAVLCEESACGSPQSQPQQTPPVNHCMIFKEAYKGPKEHGLVSPIRTRTAWMPYKPKPAQDAHQQDLCSPAMPVPPCSRCPKGMLCFPASPKSNFSQDLNKI
ncbi:uncharacterized protein LOC110408446 isoform X2 [Numida meleagris]|uniref:uncharacterized protein LOC110408446 isoform X2 n=1 Tax=Numida meleagris TaxID=8996 RepID=UPI000B3DC1C8|nr:uncharacterized protein LOC110408446 isoform X2 [Numida meleagris]